MCKQIIRLVMAQAYKYIRCGDVRRKEYTHTHTEKRWKNNYNYISLFLLVGNFFICFLFTISRLDMCCCCHYCCYISNASALDGSSIIIVALICLKRMSVSRSNKKNYYKHFAWEKARNNKWKHIFLLNFCGNFIWKLVFNGISNEMVSSLSLSLLYSE